MSPTLNGDRCALISGGTGTIGEALVRRFVAEGYRVEFTFHRSEAQALDLARQLSLRAHRIDYRSEWDPPDAAVDILVNNAGVNLSGHGIEFTTDEELRETMEVNFVAPVRLTRSFVPRMRRQGWGRVININSLYGLTAPAKRISYAASKFALRAATRSLAQELAGFGVTVNDICPGPVDSAMLRSMAAIAVEDGRFASVIDYLHDVEAEVPVGRLVKGDDVASVAAFLATDAAAACTGLAVKVDGGLLN